MGPTDSRQPEDERLRKAVSDERDRFADLLHDGALRHLAVAQQDVADALDGDRRALRAIAGRLEQVSADLRALTRGLDDEQPGLTLTQSLRRVVDAVPVGGRATVVLDVDPGADGYDDPLLLEALRELLDNVARHADAREAHASVQLEGDDVRLRVVDDGVGLAPERVDLGRADGHVGLSRLERAASRLGGTFSLTARVPRGTDATLSIPAASLAHRDGDRAGSPRHLSHARDGLSAESMIAAADRRDADSHTGDLAALERDRAATARDAHDDREVTAEDIAAVQAPSPEEVLERDDRRRSRVVDSRAASLADRGSASRDRQRSAQERLHAGADRLALVDQLSVAEIDGLTGARTRSAGLADLDRELARCRKTSDRLTVAYVDVVGLKAVNDKVGHAAGDLLLRLVVDTLRWSLRSYDLIVRMGGDEFLCAMTDASVAQARPRFARTVETLAAAPRPAAIRVGFAELNMQDTVATLIARADADLARRRGPVR